MGKIMPPVILLGFAMWFVPVLEADAQATFPQSELTMVTATGRYDFKIEVARTAAQRKQGLMFRRHMDADAGMLFDYGRDRPVAMWMKNTLIALDMLFIGADGRIVNIARDATPGSLSNIPSSGPVRAVLELNAGTVARLDIRPGDRIEHEIFRGGAANQ
ncbi:MAG: DUF192 domain-containing protein [Alphaproteobacteria bacterium]